MFKTTKRKIAVITLALIAGLVVLSVVGSAAEESARQAELGADSPTRPPPAAIEATVKAPVAERLQSQALDAGTVLASPPTATLTPTATPNPRLECDSPDLLAEAERDYNLNYRPAKIAYSYDILEVSREPGKLTCAALVEQVDGDHFQFDYGYQDRRGIYGSRGYRISTPTPMPGPPPTATPTPPTSSHTPGPPQTAPIPTATTTPEPAATATLEPTATPTPSATATPNPIALAPTAMPTPTPTAMPTPTATPTPIPTPTATPRPTGPVSSPQELAERFEASIVRVMARIGLFFGSSGSGFIFDVEGGTAFVATNHHVIDGAGALDVELTSGTSYEALLLGWDADRDIAVLAICCAADFVSIPWEPVTPTPDLNVVAVGYPRGGTEGQTITVGEVVAADALSTQYDFIAHSAPLNPGNSGGPLFSMPEAKLLGVNTARSLQTLTFYAVPYQVIAEPMKEWRNQLVIRPVPTPEPDSSFDPIEVMGSLYTVNRVVDPASGRPAAGMRLVSVDLTQEALADDVHYSHWDFHVEDTDSFLYDRKNSGDAQPSFGVGTLATDQKVRGWITFEVPATATLVSILVKPPGFNSQKHMIADLAMSNRSGRTDR